MKLKIGDKVPFIGSRLSPVAEEVESIHVKLKGNGLMLSIDELETEAEKVAEWQKEHGK